MLETSARQTRARHVKCTASTRETSVDEHRGKREEEATLGRNSGSLDDQAFLIFCPASCWKHRLQHQPSFSRSSP